MTLAPDAHGGESGNTIPGSGYAAARRFAHRIEWALHTDYPAVIRPPHCSTAGPVDKPATARFEITNHVMEIGMPVANLASASLSIGTQPSENGSFYPAGTGARYCTRKMVAGIPVECQPVNSPYN